jgi:hypothetical protein
MSHISGNCRWHLITNFPHVMLLLIIIVTIQQPMGRFWAHPVNRVSRKGTLLKFSYCNILNAYKHYAEPTVA